MSMANPQKKSPLPGLELTQDVLFSTEAGEKQVSRRAIGLELAAALLDGPLEWVQTEDGPAVLNTDTGELVDDRSAAFAALLAFAGDESNHAAGVLDATEGQVFHAGTSFWKSSLRLDPNWMETMRRRSRHRAHVALKAMIDGLTPEEKAARQYGWRQRLTFKLITPTMPHLTGTSTLDETRRLNKAIELLKKRALWRGAVAGGVKGVEDALDADGPHVHAHILVLSQYINRDQLGIEWRDCLDVATRSVYGFGLAEDCLVLPPHIKLVRKKHGPPSDDVIGWEDALNETTKYITKPADFLKRDDRGRRVSRETLLDICEVRRWPRMFELLGRCRNASHAAKRSNLAEAALAALQSIHRAYSTGELPNLPDSVGWEWVESWDLETDGPEEKRKLVILALKEREREKRKPPRPPTWRALLDTIDLSSWLGIMAERFRRGREYRIRQILDTNPSAYLVTMSGRVLGCAPDCVAVA